MAVPPEVPLRELLREARIAALRFARRRRSIKAAMDMEEAWVRYNEATKAGEAIVHLLGSHMNPDHPVWSRRFIEDREFKADQQNPSFREISEKEFSEAKRKLREYRDS